MELENRHRVDSSGPNRNDGQTRIDFDRVLNKIGCMGWFQKKQVLLLWIITLSTGPGLLSFAFTGHVPKYRCSVNQCEDPSNATYHGRGSGQKLPDFFRQTGDNHACMRTAWHYQNGSKAAQSCQEITSYLTHGNDSHVTYLVKVVEECSMEEVIFDKDAFISTFAVRLGLVCSEYYLRGIFNALGMGGMLLGSFIVGILSDKFGRKPVLVAAIVLLSISGVANAFVYNRLVFAILRLLVGMTSIGCWITCWILVAEATLPTYTVRATKVQTSGFPCGALLMTVAAYYIRDEYRLQIALFSPILLLLIPLYFVEESPRWLNSKGRLKEVNKIIQRMAMQNGFSTSDCISDILAGPRSVSRTDATATDRSSNRDETAVIEKLNLVDLFWPRKILARSVNLFFQWFTVTAMYYGISFGSTSLLGCSPHLNFALSQIVTLPGLAIGFVTFDRVGRWWSLTSLQAAAGVCCISIGLIEKYSPTMVDLETAFVLLGNLCAILAFSLVYLYCGEMYATPLRATSIGFCSSFGRIGGIFALAIEGTKEVWIPMPFFLIGICGLVSSWLVWWLPETTGEKLPETTEQALQVGKQYKLRPWACRSDRKITPRM